MCTQDTSKEQSMWIVKKKIYHTRAFENLYKDFTGFCNVWSSQYIIHGMESTTFLTLKKL